MKTYDKLIQLFDDSVFSKSIVVIGLGNMDRADDSVGLVLTSKLQVDYPERVFLETKHSLETLVSGLIDREDVQTILFIDATRFGGEPGDIRFFYVEDIERFVPALSTHKIPMSLLMGLIRDHGKTPVLLGIEPKSIELFGTMSPEIENVINQLERAIRGCLLKEDSKID